MNADDRHEIESLISALCDGTIDGPQLKRLEQTLRDSAESRRLYLQYVDMHARLTVHPNLASGIPLHDTSRETSRDDEVVLELARVALEGFPRDPRQSRSRSILSVAMVTALVLVSAGVYWWMMHGDQPIVATIEEVAGQVELIEADGTVRAATDGDVLLAGQQLRAASEGGRFRLRYNDGTLVDVGPDSTIAIPKHRPSDGKQIHLQSGTAMLEVTPQPESRPMRVTTPHAGINVIGTRFQLRSDRKQTRVDLLDGRLRVVRKADDKAVELTANTYATVAKHTKPLVARTLPPRLTEPRLSLARAGRNVGLSSDGQLLATASGRELRVWNTSDGSQVDAIAKKAKNAWIRFGRESNDRILILDKTCKVRLWDRVAKREKTLLTLKAQRGAAISAEAAWVAVAKKEREVHIFRWDNASKKLKRHATFAPLQSVTQIAISDDGPRVVVGSWNGNVRVYDGSTGKPLAFFDRNGKGTVIATAISSDGRLVASAWSKGSRVEVFDLMTNKSWATEAGVSRANCLHFSADGKWIAAGSDDGTARVWSTESGKLKRIVDRPSKMIRRVVLSGDGSTLVTATRSGDVHLWDVTNPESDRRANEK